MVFLSFSPEQCCGGSSSVPFFSCKLFWKSNPVSTLCFLIWHFICQPVCQQVSFHFTFYLCIPHCRQQSGAQLLYVVTLKFILCATNDTFPNDSYQYKGQLCKFSEIEMHAFTKLTGFLDFPLFYYRKQ